VDADIATKVIVINGLFAEEREANQVPVHQVMVACHRDFFHFTVANIDAIICLVGEARDDTIWTSVEVGRSLALFSKLGSREIESDV